MKSTIEDEGLKKKLAEKYEEIKDRLAQAEEVLQVVDVTKDEYEKALKELENFINPIMQKIVADGGGENIPQRPPPQTQPVKEHEPESNIEEID